MIIHWKIQGIRSEGVPEDLGMEVHDIVQEAVIKTIPKGKKMQKDRTLKEEPLRSVGAQYATGDQ